MAEIKIDASRAIRSVKELNKQLDETKKGVASIDAASNDMGAALDSVSKNTDTLTKGMQSADSILGKFGSSGKETKKILDSIKGAIPSLQSGLVNLASGVGTLAAGLSVGLSGALAAVVLLWKRMTESADYYFNSVEGSIKKSGIEEYKNTLRGLAIEHRNLEDSVAIVTRLGEAWNNSAQFLRNYLTAKLDAKDFADEVLPIISAIKNTKEDIKVAKEAQELAERRQKALIQQKITEGEVQKLFTEIADMEADAMLYATESVKRKELVAKIEEKVTEVYDLRKNALSEIVETTKELNSKTMTSTEDYLRQVELENQLLAIDTERERKLKNLSRLQNRVYRETAGSATTPPPPTTPRTMGDQLAKVDADKTAASVYNWGGNGILDAKATTKEIDGMANAMNTLVTAEYAVSDATREMAFSFSDWITLSQDSIAAVTSGIQDVTAAFMANMDSDSKAYKALATIQIIANTLAGAMATFVAPDNITMAQKIASYAGVIATGVGSIVSLNSGKLNSKAHATVPQLSAGLPTSQTAINTANTANAVEDSQVYITEKQLNDNDKKQAKIKEKTTF